MSKEMDAMTAGFMSRWRVYKKGREGGGVGNTTTTAIPPFYNIEPRSSGNGILGHNTSIDKTTVQEITPKSWKPEELKALQERNDNREKRLTKILSKYPKDVAKWDYPAQAIQVIEEARREASEYHELLSRDLTAALEWPTPEMADENYFYQAKEANSIFNRNKNWFAEEGFHDYETAYTFSNRWDKQEVTTIILVPKGLPQGHKAPVMWYFHGGGFCTGAANFIPWYSATAIKRAREKNAVIIAPNYCLGPEGNYVDIYESMQDFLRWYKEDGCLEPGDDSWETWLSKQKPLSKGLTLDKNHIYIEGESAGAHAAVTAMWLNAAKDGTHIPIDVALLRYPMIVHYKRDWPEKTHQNPDGKVSYMAKDHAQQLVKDCAKNFQTVIEKLEAYDLVPTCVARPPPRGMAFAVLLSMTQTWQLFFQRQHGKKLGEKVDPKDPRLMDGVERAERCAGDVIPKFLPPIHIFQGHDDINCKPEDTDKFVAALRNPKLYGKRFEGDEMLFFDVVHKLNTKPIWDEKAGKLIFQESGVVDHGFDYYLHEEDEPFLQRAYEKVARLWSPGA